MAITMSKIKNGIDLVSHAVGTMSTTNLRIYCTLLCVLWTAANYTVRTDPLWIPSDSWLGFLAVMSGLDMGQFYAKRKTSFPPPNDVDILSRTPAQPEVEDCKQSTDVHELSNSVQKG